MAILEVKKTEAIAKAKLDAIEQSITDHEMKPYKAMSKTETDIKNEQIAAWLNELAPDARHTPKSIVASN